MEAFSTPAGSSSSAVGCFSAHMRTLVRSIHGQRNEPRASTCSVFAVTWYLAHGRGHCRAATFRGAQTVPGLAGATPVFAKAAAGATLTHNGFSISQREEQRGRVGLPWAPRDAGLPRRPAGNDDPMATIPGLGREHEAGSHYISNSGAVQTPRKSGARLRRGPRTPRSTVASLSALPASSIGKAVGGVARPVHQMAQAGSAITGTLFSLSSLRAPPGDRGHDGNKNGNGRT